MQSSLDLGVDSSAEVFNISCIVAGFAEQSYGKVEKRVATTAVYMEYDTIYKHFANFVPSGVDSKLPSYPCEIDGKPANCNYTDWLKRNGTQLSKDYADFMMMTLPEPREKFYQSSDYL